MTEQLTGTTESRPEEPAREARAEETRESSNGLLYAIGVGTAFVAGFLLGKRSEQGSLSLGTDDIKRKIWTTPGSSKPDELSGQPAKFTESVGVEETTTKQPSSMGSVAGEEERERERDEGVEDEGRTESEGTIEETESDKDVTAFSPPTTHGMPMLGLGTYQMDDYDECVESVKMALEIGYRHIDTAEGYENESAVGDAIAESDVPRDDLFVATKVSPDNLDYDHILTSAEESLDRLGLDYVDLLYVHWPTGEYEATDTLKAFAELRDEGLIEEIGVSNFTVDLLEEAVNVAEEPIFANQVEMHPLLPQENLREFCAQDDIDVELVAYSPIARGDVGDVDELQEIAEKHDATPARVSLAWCREKDVTTIPKATSREHLRENWLSLGVELDDEDMERIDDIDRAERLVDPDRAPWNE